MSEAGKLRTTCPKCGTRYRLDASRLQGKQANIKCSNCETVFRVRVGQPSREATAPYIVVNADTGDQLAVPSLDTLKRWIIEGKVHADDHLTKAGIKKRRIGDVEQFKPFLRVSERSGSYEALASRPLDNEEAEGDASSDSTADDVDEVGGTEDRDAPGTGDTPDEADDSEPDEVGTDEKPEPGQPESAEDHTEPDASPALETDLAEAQAADELGEHAPVTAASLAPEPPAIDPEVEPAALAKPEPEPEDDLPVKLETGTGRRVALALLLVVLLGAAALAGLYFAAPDTFYGLFPFLEG